MSDGICNLSTRLAEKRQTFSKLDWKNRIQRSSSIIPSPSRETSAKLPYKPVRTLLRIGHGPDTADRRYYYRLACEIHDEPFNAFRHPRKWSIATSLSDLNLFPPYSYFLSKISSIPFFAPYKPRCDEREIYPPCKIGQGKEETFLRTFSTNNHHPKNVSVPIFFFSSLARSILVPHNHDWVIGAGQFGGQWLYKYRGPGAVRARGQTRVACVRVRRVVPRWTQRGSLASVTSQPRFTHPSRFFDASRYLPPSPTFAFLIFIGILSWVDTKKRVSSDGIL